MDTTSMQNPRAGLPAEGHLLIVGAGLAGYHVARGARLTGHVGPITVLGDELHPAYDRPALSKAFLSGAAAFEHLVLDDPENPLDVTWFGGAAAEHLSAFPLGVHTSDGRFHAADAVVVATGAQACRLPLSGGATFVLRNIDDAMALRSRVIENKRIAIVGGGFLALEAGATCVERGAAEVTVAAGEDYPGTARLGVPVGQAVRKLHERHGVSFAPASRADSVRDVPGGQELVLANGHRVEADIVICAIGATPATSWLRDGVLSLDPTSGAILCDDTGFTGMPGIWAAGDCAQWASQASGLRPVGHWQEAVEQAGILSASLTGTSPAPFQEPYFWSEQYEVKIQAAGRISHANEVRVVDGSIETDDLLLSYLRDGAEVGILGFNRLREVKRWRKQRQIRTADVLVA
ncbi:FAD/NAD(P)-binding oxidoreductase [Nesterenkonia sp. HG001]|uniref:NAD(P)/FAD-dependent oxidoreductase n=1 Tax=Nesterenkonia sp. HG001 TaxID=2983207 RepID=UPI002AC42E80|nr:FAD/NAD(P)-binding oxidoreductase [Nesterenkonia sp. HG001]MDZ5079208.1 NAD(P)/FAD-dependent oxidoreductase [Nesterenkonia sp. HG001]